MSNHFNRLNRRQFFTAWFASIVILFCCSAVLSTPIDWPDVSLNDYSSEFRSPVRVITHAGDGSGRLFVAEQAGIIHVLDQQNPTNSNVFLDISDRVAYPSYWGSDLGLVGLAFPPDFAHKQYFYVYHSVSFHAMVLSRFFVNATNANVADCLSEQVLLTISQSSDFHKGGQLAFGPDGYLYIGVGEDPYLFSDHKNSQDPAVFRGKILRIDVESTPNGYLVPASNPFVGKPGYLPEIWALGLCNPAHFSFDRATGDLYIADMGLNSYDEVNFQPASSPGGQNYGWAIKEAAHDLVVPPGFDTNSLTPPVLEYPLNGYHAARSLTGGYVCRAEGSGRMAGIYIAADRAGTGLLGLKHDGTSWQNAVIPYVRSNSSSDPVNLWSLGEDEAGNLYIGVTVYPNSKVCRLADTGCVLPVAVMNESSYTHGVKTVTLGSLTPDSTFRYTFENRDPIATDPELPSGGQIQITSNVVVHAQAFKDGLLPSRITQISMHCLVEAPIITPSSTNIAEPIYVSISSPTPGSRMHYYNAWAPSYNPMSYTGPILVQPETLLVVIAEKDGCDSNSSSAEYRRPTCTVPLISPESGSVPGGTPLILTGKPGETIHYTLDGTEPDESSPTYISPVPFPLPVTVTARAFRDGYYPSDAATATFVQLAVESPSISLPTQIYGDLAPYYDGLITNGTLIAITASTPGATIRYTVDGSKPTANSRLYQKPFPAQGNTTVKAIAMKDGYLTSPVTTQDLALLDFEPVKVTLLAGNGRTGYRDGTATGAMFNLPVGVCADLTGNVYVAEFFGNRIRKISSKGMVTTLAGTGVAGLADGPGNTAQFNNPREMCIGIDGAIYVTDEGNHIVRRIAPNGFVTTIAGSGEVGQQDGSARKAQFGNFLHGITVDLAGNVYILSDGVFRKITRTGTVSTIHFNDTPVNNSAIWVTIATDPSGNLFSGSFASSEAFGSATVFKRITPFAGTTKIGGSYTGRCDGLGGFARISLPHGLARDIQGNLYFSDDNNYSLRKMRPNGRITTLFGSYGDLFSNPSSRAFDSHASPGGVCVDLSGNVYFSSFADNSIYKLTPAK